MLNIKTIDLEKKSVFFINSLFVVLITIFFFLDINLSYFFYILIGTTFILSYLFFKRSKNVSKYLILTNIFIFFYFLYPKVAEFLYLMFGTESYLFVLFYNILVAYIFLAFSGFHKTFLNNIRKFNIKIAGLVVIIGILFGILFYFIKEPIPLGLFNPLAPDFYSKVIFFTLMLGISEQIIFSGFLFNIYSKLTHKKEAMFQVAILFFLFHILRFEQLINTYIENFGSWFIFAIIGYYVLIVLFMLTCLYLYSFTASKKHKLVWHGNFVYPVILHFVTDLVLFLIYKITF